MDRVNDSADEQRTSEGGGAATSIEEDGEVAVDGRRLRRDRNREAVLESLIDLVEGGELVPTVAQIAERSSVSLRSVFRYFDDRQGLLDEATELAFRRYAPLSAIRNFGSGSLSQRVRAISDQRLLILPAIGPIVRTARHHGAEDPAMLDSLDTLLAPLHDQVEHQFRAELVQLGDDRDPVTASLEILLSLETFELLTHTQQRTTDEVRRVYSVTIESLLRPARG